MIVSWTGPLVHAWKMGVPHRHPYRYRRVTAHLPLFAFALPLAPAFPAALVPAAAFVVGAAASAVDGFAFGAAASLPAGLLAGLVLAALAPAFAPGAALPSFAEALPSFAAGFSSGTAAFSFAAFAFGAGLSSVFLSLGFPAGALLAAALPLGFGSQSSVSPCTLR
eukprot:Selendium_serpulae@DN6173_c0_g1_i1.p2